MTNLQAVRALRLALSAYLPWHGARLTLVAQFILALLQVRSVNLAELATALPSRAKRHSNYIRWQRFFRGFVIDQEWIARTVAQWLPLPERWVLTLDRTNWRLGRVEINLLVLAVQYQQMALPLLWTVLGKAGNSNTAERRTLMERFIGIFGRARIAYLLADREFIGGQWLEFLRREGIGFRIRLKADALLSTARGQRPVLACFQDLAVGERRVLRKARTLWGCRVYLAALRLESEWLIVMSADHPQRALSDYAQRWTIETLFGALKSRGFRLESTHLTEPERLSRLLALLALATAWAVHTGHWLAQQQPIAQKNSAAGAVLAVSLRA
ncbi:MAG: IS4 family transposase [Gammaproteobacteria bacterium]